MAAHNAPFEARVLGFEYKRADIEPAPGSFLDSLPLSRRWIPEASDHKLLTLCQMLDLDAMILSPIALSRHRRSPLPP